MPLVLGIAGYSGAGKTTLLEALLPRLTRRGWRVGVLKHDAHRLDLDRKGKDTARLYDAGASLVCAHDPTQRFVRSPCDGPALLSDVLSDLPADLDLLLVEGHKHAAIPKVALEHPDDRPPIDGPLVLDSLPWDADRPALAESLVVTWAEDTWRRRPVGVAVWVDGAASELETMLEQLRPVDEHPLLVGTGRATREGAVGTALLMAPDCGGPLAGLLALLRHDPNRAWLLVSVDYPRFAAAHYHWLCQQRQPGKWAVTPQAPGRGAGHPLAALYEPALRPHVERSVARGAATLAQALEGAPATEPTPPAELAAGWMSATT